MIVEFDLDPYGIEDSTSPNMAVRSICIICFISALLQQLRSEMQKTIFERQIIKDRKGDEEKAQVSG